MEGVASVDMKHCSVDGCDRTAKAKGMCNRHYENQRLRGSAVPVKERPLVDRLTYKVTGTGCWEFTGKVNDRGYGIVHAAVHGVEGERAHRVAYREWVGEIPDDMVVMHQCDNPPCINPEHLKLGTHADNMADMVAKRRHWAHSKTHCPNGHPYTEENTYRPGRGGRECLTCKRERGNKYTRKTRSRT